MREPTFNDRGDVPIDHEMTLMFHSSQSGHELVRSVCRALSATFHGTGTWDLTYFDGWHARLALYDSGEQWSEQLSFDSQWFGDGPDPEEEAERSEAGSAGDSVAVQQVLDWVTMEDGS